MLMNPAFVDTRDTLSTILVYLFGGLEHQASDVLFVFPLATEYWCVSLISSTACEEVIPVGMPLSVVLVLVCGLPPGFL